jgi:ribonuclease HI
MFCSATATVGAVAATEGETPRSSDRTPQAAHCRGQAGETLTATPILPGRATAAACDGACKRGGYGGWGYVIELADGHQLTGSGAELETTNNRQELRAAIAALHALAELPQAGPVELATDSQYVRDNLTRSLPRWKRNGWRTAEGQPVKNRDLWQQLEQAAAAAPWVELVWVRGHNGHPLNEAADQLASAAAEQLRQQQAQQTAAGLAPIGSAWDADTTSPDGLLAEHRSEWLGSAVAPELIAANVVSLAGADVLEALAGDRIEALYKRSTHYVPTGNNGQGGMARLLRPLEPIAAAGGWWVDGLDPLADWATMAWGQFKAAQPRWNHERNRAIKYEAPVGQRTRSAWLRVPAAVAQLVADRFGLPLPAAVAADHNGKAGAFWRWVATEPRLPLLLTEGAKKAGALLSAGVPAVALPGIWNGAPRDPATDRAALLPDLAAVPWAKRQALVLFDWSDSGRGRRDVARAARRLGHHLRRAGAADVLVGICPGPHKGADDHLAAGGTWEQLAAALQPLQAEPALHRTRAADQIAPAGYLADGVNLQQLADQRLLAIAAPMGAGKTLLARELMAPHLADGVPIVAPTHRTSLGEASAAAVGLPWAAAPDDVERLQGLGLCWDSLRPTSGLRINAADWAGSVLLLDEVAQGIEHLLFGTGTAVAQHRSETLDTTAALLRTCRAAVAMDAQLSEPVLQLLETLTGSSAHLLRSAHRPMTGRPVLVPQGLTARTAAEQGRAHVLRLAKAGARVLVITTAQQAGVKGSAQNLARLVKKHRPTARVLMIDSTTPEAAAALGGAPNETAAAHDWIIASPAITSGLSIDQHGLFDEVLVIGAGGRLTCEHIAQAAARVRDPRCPVTIYAPEMAPQLRIGSGDTSPADLLKHLAATEAQLLAALVGAAGWQPSATNESPWLRCWLEMAAHRNRQSHAYSATIAALLEGEGWTVTTTAPAAEDVVLVAEASADLGDIAKAAQAAEDAAVIAAAPITAAAAADLADKRRRTPAEQAQLQRHRIAARWGLGAADPSPELLAADRERLSQRLRFAWILQDVDFRQLAAAHDQRRAQQLTTGGKAWAPDLSRELLGHKIAAADALGLPKWLCRRDWISSDDQQLQQLHTTATAHAGSMAANLGIPPGKRASGTLRALLRLCGFRLESRRARCGNGRRGWQYRITPEPLPHGVNLQQLAAAWADQLATGGG